MTQFFDYAVPGVPFGCVFALMAVGLVLTFKASGIFNLAFGAQAFVSALAFVFLVQDGWSRWAAGLVAIVVLSPFVGVVLDRLLFRRVRTASPLVKLVPTLGLLVALPQVALIVAGGTPAIAPPSLFLDAQHVYFHLGSVPFSGLEISIAASTVVVVAVLVALFRFTPVGLEMRAVVESPRLTELTGVNAGRVSTFAWLLSSCMAGLAGVLLAPLYSQLSPENFNVLLIWGIAGAVIGRFASLPMALVGGLLLGVGQQVLAGYLPPGIIATGLRPSLPFIVLLVFLPFSQPRGAGDPLAAVEAPQTAMVGAARSYRAPRVVEVAPDDSRVQTGGRWHRAFRPGGAISPLRRALRRPTTTVAWVLAALGIVSALTWVQSDWLLTMTQGVAFGVIFLSLTLLTGMSGQISLCQAAFAGVGGFTAGQLVVHTGMSVLVGMVLGGLVAALVGAVVALPTLRLAGLPLALATLAFGLLADNVLFPNSWAGNGASGVPVPRPQIGTVSFGAPRSFFVLSLVVLALVAVIVKLVGDGTTGRFLGAMRGSEMASSSIGIDVHRLRVAVFALSAGLAGVGGALYGSMEMQLSPADFDYQISLVFLVVVAIIGLGSITGAVVAGLVYTVLQRALETLPVRYAGLLAVLFGLATLSYTRHPQGFVDYLAGRFSTVVAHLERSTRAGPIPPSGGPGDGPGSGAPSRPEGTIPVGPGGP